MFKKNRTKVSPVEGYMAQQQGLHLEKDVFSLPRIMFQFSAMWSFDYDKILPSKLMFLAPILDYIYRGFINLNTLHITVLCAVTTVVKIPDGFDAMSIFVLNFVIYGWINIAAAYYAWHEKRTRLLCKFIEGELLARSAAGLTFVSMKGAVKKGKIVLSAWMMLTLVAGCSMATIPLFEGNRQLLLPLSYPFDPYKPVVFEIVYALQYLGQIHISGVFVMTCGYLYYCIFLICGQFDILCANIKNLGYTALIKKGVKVSTLQHLQRLTNLDPMNEFVLGTDVEEKENLRMVVGVEDQGESSKNTVEFRFSDVQGLDEYLREAIVECVKLHEKILRICQEVELYFTPIMFGKMADITLLLTFILYSLVSMSKAFFLFFTNFYYSRHFLMISSSKLDCLSTSTWRRRSFWFFLT